MLTEEMPNKSFSFSEDILIPTSQRIRQIFCYAMRDHLLRYQGKESLWGNKHMHRWDGGERPSDGKTFQPVWPKIAEFVLTNELDPQRLVEAVFNSKFGGDAPTPTDCYNKNALALYRKYCERPEADIDMKNALTNQINTARTQITVRSNYKKLGFTDEDIVRGVLTDDNLSLSAVFRFCVAYREHFDDIVDRYRIAAMRQYHGERSLYDRIWIDWIPEELSSASDSISSLAACNRR